MDNAIGVRQQPWISCRNIHRLNYQLFFRTKSGQRGKLLTLDKSAFAYRSGTANYPKHLLKVAAVHRTAMAIEVNRRYLVGRDPND